MQRSFSKTANITKYLYFPVNCVCASATKLIAYVSIHVKRAYF